jgi:hypothetical protein
MKPAAIPTLGALLSGALIASLNAARADVVRYVFVEVDHPRQSFGVVVAPRGVENIISRLGVPCVAI